MVAHVRNPSTRGSGIPGQLGQHETLFRINTKQVPYGNYGGQNMDIVETKQTDFRVWEVMQFSGGTKLAAPKS